MKTLTIKDENLAGKILHEISLQFEREYVTVKELIEERIRKEVDKYMNEVAEYRHGLVQPGATERRMNGSKKERKIDLEQQILVALDAFQKNGFFILIDNEQAEDLEQQFLIQETTHVSFVKLTPLVGG